MFFQLFCARGMMELQRLAGMLLPRLGGIGWCWRGYRDLLFNEPGTQMISDDLYSTGIHQCMHVAMMHGQHQILELLV